MNGSDRNDVESRISRLEESVTQIKQSLQLLQKQLSESELGKGQTAHSSSVVHKPLPDSPGKTRPLPAVASRTKFKLPAHMRSNEYWLNKAGIALLLFGVVFLFKYSIDKGWLNPTVRLLFGIGTGTLLVGLGLRLYNKRRQFAQVMFGGGIATFYITGFSAFQIFNLVSFAAAMTFMVAVTLLVFALSLRQDESTLALLGALGGLGTPFLLYTDSGNLPMLILYTCCLLTGTLAIYFYKGWRGLLGVSVIGGWIVFFIAIDSLRLPSVANQLSDQWVVQAAVFFAWLGFGGLPLYRELLRSLSPERWAPPKLSFLTGKVTPSAINVVNRQPQFYALTVPLFVLIASMMIWNLDDSIFGLIAIGVSACYALLGWVVRERNDIHKGATVFGIVSAFLLTAGLVLFLEGDLLMFALVTEAGLFHLFALRHNERAFATAGHILYFLLSFWMLDRLLNSNHLLPFLNKIALADLWFVIIGFATAYRLRNTNEKVIYFVIAHAVLLVLQFRELENIANGQAWVSIAWGIYGVAILIAGLRFDLKILRVAGLATLGLLIAKLFLVDLSNLETIWRVMLFMGFGSLFLVVSYFFRSFWKKPSPPASG